MKLRWKKAADGTFASEAGEVSILTIQSPNLMSAEIEEAQKAKLGKIIKCNMKMSKEIASSKIISKDDRMLKVIKFYSELKKLADANDIEFGTINQALILQHSVKLSNAIQTAQRYILSQAAISTFDIELEVDGKALTSLVSAIDRDDGGIESQMIMDLPEALKDFFSNIINERRVRYASI